MDIVKSMLAKIIATKNLLKLVELSSLSILSSSSILKPAFSMAALRLSILQTFGSYSTLAFSVAIFTIADSTPGVFLSDLSADFEQAAQDIPKTEKSIFSNLIFLLSITYLLDLVYINKSNTIYNSFHL